MTRRFFVEGMDASSGRVELEGEEFVHLKRVLRLAPGAEVVLLNGRGLARKGRVSSVGKGSASVEVTGPAEAAPESHVRIVLVQALLKGDRPELIVQKATELGIAGVRFYASSRSVPRPGEGRSVQRLQRLKRVAVEGAKQCGRAVLPEIEICGGLGEALSGLSGLRLIFWECAGAVPLKGLLANSEMPKEAAAVVGPEGGFSEDEAATALSAGFLKASLGPRVMRAETAAIAALTVLQYALGDLG